MDNFTDGCTDRKTGNVFQEIVNRSFPFEEDMPEE